MPLTHVCVWDSKIGYRRITVEEACKMYPYGASARSGHFVCELCAQNVLLTAPGMNVQHFRHDPASPNKECDERQASFDPNYRLPPSEENFFKLYSWPVRYDFTSKTPQVFTRMMARQIYPMFKHELESMGYCFVEE